MAATHWTDRRTSPLWRLAAMLTVAALAPPAHPEEITLQEYGHALRVHADLGHGESLFQRCAACHAVDGHGSGDGLVPLIAAQNFRVIVWQLIDYGQDKRWDIRMQALVSGHDALSVQDIVDVAAFASTLPPTSAQNTGTGEYAAHGATLFGNSCIRCHGPAGEGDDTNRVPMLAGQSFAYLLRQMHDAVEGRRPNFPASHVRLLKPLDRNDLVGVADYLSRSGPSRLDR